MKIDVYRKVCLYASSVQVCVCVCACVCFCVYACMCVCLCAYVCSDSVYASEWVYVCVPLNAYLCQ